MLASAACGVCQHSGSTEASKHVDTIMKLKMSCELYEQLSKLSETLEHVLLLFICINVSKYFLSFSCADLYIFDACF